jgi:hypothetical protein
MVDRLVSRMKNWWQRVNRRFDPTYGVEARHHADAAGATGAETHGIGAGGVTGGSTGGN